MVGRQHPETVLSGYVVLDNQHRPQRLLARRHRWESSRRLLQRPTYQS
jgi:hypothetical protein